MKRGPTGFALGTSKHAFIDARLKRVTAITASSPNILEIKQQQRLSANFTDRLWDDKPANIFSANRSSWTL